MPERSLAVDVPRPYKREAGMTRVFATPLHLRISGVVVDPELEASVPALLGRKLERYAKNVTRVALRFVDINGPRGGIDTVCRIEMSVKDRDHLVVEARARDAIEAFRKASTLARAALARALEKRPRGSRRTFASRAQPSHPAGPPRKRSTTTRPARKSTRKSAQRQKSGAHHAPKGRAARR